MNDIQKQQLTEFLFLIDLMTVSAKDKQGFRNDDAFRPSTDWQ
jgi:hypothetical protein